jgi:Glycosyl transferase family 2
MTKTQPKNKQQKPTINNKQNSNVIVCWCDNGLTDGKFTEGLVYSILNSNVPIKSAMRVQGNQIGRQRQNAFDYWYDETDFDWILWVDSDIVLTKQTIETLWNVADKTARPVVTGVYFISKENERSLMTPFPALFSWTENKHQLAYVHPLPKNALIQVGAAGFGFLFMHRSAAKIMRDTYGNTPFFNETGVGEQFVSEDINFFRYMYDAGVPLWAHTGATVQHMKRFSYDVGFYQMFWDQQKEKAEDKLEELADLDEA